MKKTLLFIAALITLSIFTPSALAEEETDAAVEQKIRQNIGELDLAGWQQTIDELTPELRGFLHDSNAVTLLYDTALNGLQWNNTNIVQSIRNILNLELKGHLKFLCSIVGISLLCGIMNALIGNGKRGLQEITGFVFYCFAVCTAIVTFSNSVSIGKQAVDMLSSFIEAAFPVLLTLLGAAGAAAGSGMMQPAMSMLTGIASIAIQNIVIPLVLSGGVLAVLNSFTGRAQLGQLYRLNKAGTKWILGLMFTLYTGVVTLQGLSVKSIDGISVRTAKFAMDRFIPIVGGMVSGTMDTVVGCAVLVKNAAGVTAILLTALMVTMPLLKIGGSIFIYRVAAALCEPIADQRIPKLLADISDILNYLFAAVIVISIMFIITVGLIIGMNGISGG